MGGKGLPELLDGAAAHNARQHRRIMVANNPAPADELAEAFADADTSG